MLNEIVKAFVEGRGSMASLERAIEQSENPMMARAEIEKELAAEWSLKNLFSTIPPPSVGLPRVMAALKSAPTPQLSPAMSELLEEVGNLLRATVKDIPEPAGGFSAAIARLKNKLATTPLTAPRRNAEMDVTPGFDSGVHLVKKTKRTTQKIVRMPRYTKSRDVLAAGKDLPENPNDLPNA